MYKKIVFSLTLIVALLAVPLSVGASGTLPGGGWWTSTAIQNVGGADGTVQMTAFDSVTSNSFPSSEINVPSGHATTIMPNAIPGLSAGFQGSAVVSSNQPAVAVALVANYPFAGLGTGGGKAAARYQGTNSPATTLYAPIVKHNWFNLTNLFYIQNAGTQAVTATVTFNMGLTNPQSYNFVTPSIQPGVMVVVSPADAGVPTGPSNNATQVNLGTMVVTASQPLAGSAVEYRTDQAVPTAITSMRLMSSADFGTEAFGPSIKHNWFNRFMGIAILNTTGANITATVSYKGTQGGCAGQEYQDTVANIAPNRRGTVILGPGGSTNFPSNCVGTARVTATGNFVATVQENNTGNVAPSLNVTYMLPGATATTKVAAPTFYDQRDSLTSGFQVMNVGGEPTTITATFYCLGQGNSNTPFTAVSNAINVNAGSSFLFFRPFQDQGGSFSTPFAHNNSLCSVMVQSGGQPIVGLMNTIAVLNNGAVDDSKYEAFNLAP